MGRVPGVGWVAFAAAFAGPVPVLAGEVFGTLSEQGKPLPNLSLSLRCDGGPSASGQTDQFGAYRLFVNFEGTCAISVPNAAPLSLRSAREPQRFNLELVRTGGQVQLRRR